jgi:hypothetical protein
MSLPLPLYTSTTGSLERGEERAPSEEPRGGSQRLIPKP